MNGNWKLLIDDEKLLNKYMLDCGKLFKLDDNTDPKDFGYLLTKHIVDIVLDKGELLDKDGDIDHGKLLDKHYANCVKLADVIEKDLTDIKKSAKFTYYFLFDEGKLLQNKHSSMVKISTEMILNDEITMKNIKTEKKNNDIKSYKKNDKQKPKKKQIPKIIRDLVFKTYEKECNGKCWCCNDQPISYTNFQCGHIKSEKDGGLQEVENLRPICVSCNLSMRTQNMITFKQQHGLIAHLPIVKLNDSKTN